MIGTPFLLNNPGLGLSFLFLIPFVLLLLLLILERVSLFMLVLLLTTVPKLYPNYDKLEEMNDCSRKIHIEFWAFLFQMVKFGHGV